MREQDRFFFPLQESEGVRRVGLVPWAARRHRQIGGGGGGSVQTHPERPTLSSCLLRQGSIGLATTLYFAPWILAGLRVASSDLGGCRRWSGEPTSRPPPFPAQRALLRALGFVAGSAPPPHPRLHLRRKRQGGGHV